MTTLEMQSKSVILLIGLILLSIVGCIDFMTGYEVSFSVFYLIPIFVVTWFTSKRSGFLFSLLSCLVWFSADRINGHPYSQPLIPVWNTFIRFTFFSIVILLLSALRESAKREAAMARTDYLTGAVSTRFFYDIAKIEIDRLERYKHPFTLAYIDLDNFKILNDQCGHTSGDQALRTIVHSAKKNTRKTDVIARIGGDEFVILLPETNQESAHIVLSKLQAALLDEMHVNNWPITFSIGILTCSAAPATVKDLVKMTDDLMYEVKHDGKNALKYATYDG